MGKDIEDGLLIFLVVLFVLIAVGVPSILGSILAVGAGFGTVAVVVKIIFKV